MGEHSGDGHAIDFACDDSNSLVTSQDGTHLFMVTFESFKDDSLSSCHRVSDPS